MVSKRMGIITGVLAVSLLLLGWLPASGEDISERNIIRKIFVNPWLNQGGGFSAPFGAIWCAQGFDAETSSIVKAGWYTLKEGNAPDLVFELRPDDGKGLPASEVLASASVPNAQQACWNYTYADLKYDKLIKGKRYYLVIHAQDNKGDLKDHSGTWGGNNGTIVGCGSGDGGKTWGKNGDQAGHYSIEIHYLTSQAEIDATKAGIANANKQKSGEVIALLVRTVENAAQQRKEALPPLLVRFEPSTRLIFRDEPRLVWAEQDQAVEGLKLSAARNEYESGQVVFINPGQKSVVLSAVEPQDLKQASGKGIISKQDIRVALVDYVYQGDVISGKWIPDGLPPFRSIEIPAGKYQPVWITVRIDKQTPPGKYSGSISFKTKDGQKIAVPIEIRVANAILPDKSKLKTSFWINELAAAGQFYGKKPFKINDIMPYLDLMATHRISLSHIGFHVTPRSELAVDVEPLTTIYREKDGSFSFDFTNYDKLISAVYDRKMNVFNLGIGGATYSGWEYFDVTDRGTGKVERYKPGASWENRKDWLNLAEMDSFVGAWTSALWNRYKDKYREILYYQGDDEPTPERYQSVVDLYTKVGKWAPGLPRLITKHPGEKMAPVVDIWVPLDVFFDPAASIAEQKKGKTMWWYVIGSRLSLGLSPLEARTLPWTTFKYNLSGLLYWGVNTGWTRNVAENSADRWPYKPWVLPGNPPQDETGFLIYPGPDGPVSSQRLENLRDGVEEYDLLYQLKEKVKSAEAKGITSGPWYEAASVLVKIPEEVAPERRRSLTDPDRMDYWREKLLDLLETAPN